MNCSPGVYSGVFRPNRNPGRLSYLSVSGLLLPARQTYGVSMEVFLVLSYPVDRLFLAGVEADYEDLKRAGTESFTALRFTVRVTLCMKQFNGSYPPERIILFVVPKFGPEICGTPTG